jgi:DNA-binding transcriptional LysR family regulator
MLTVISFGDKLRGVELRQLAVFVAVAEEGSFTRAADRLHVVQSAVSAGVRNLERDLGARLFDRSTHKVALSDAGRALLPEARATLAAAAAARDAVDAVSGGVRGTIVLGNLQAQGMRAIDFAGVLAEFRSEHPAVEIQIRQGGSLEMTTKVREGQLDLAFVALPDQRFPGVELVPLASEPIVLAVAADHPLAARNRVELAALGAETIVDFPAGWGIRMANDRAFAAAGLTRTIAYEVGDTGSVIGFIRHGLAVGLVPASLFENPHGIVFVPIRGRAPQYLTAIAAPSNRRPSAATRALLQTLHRHVGKQAPGHA